MQFNQKTALVSGAGRGIGKALALALAREGAHLILTGRQQHDLQATCQAIQNENGHASYLCADISQEEQVKALVDFALQETGRIDILINNAGVGAFAPADQFTEAAYDTIFDTNVKGSFLLCKHVVPLMKGQGYGHIITIASDVATRVFENGSVYCASKYAQHAFTAALRKEVRAFGVRVGTIFPGLTNSSFNNSQPDTPEKLQWLQPSDIADAMLYMLKANPKIQVDEIVLHPMIQSDY